MKRNSIIYGLLAITLNLLVGCGESDVNDPRGSDAIPMPIDLNTVVVKNLSGTSHIFYERPNDENVRYIQAAYTLSDGTERKFNASYFTDSLVVDGFPEAGEYEVKLYSVSYAEKRSEPVSVTIHPEKPPYKKVLDECQVEPTFSGFRFTSVDEIGTDLSIICLKKTEGGTWEEFSAYYTRKSNKLQHTVRGMDAVETDLGFYATDKWGHKSDTTYFTLTPWFEMEIPKKNPLWKNVALPGDAEMHAWSGGKGTIEALWDEDKTSWYTCYHTVAGAGLPKSTTIDLGAKYLFSRILFHWRGSSESACFNEYCPKTFEVYGSNNPNMSGEWDDSWTKLETFNVLREDGSQTLQRELPLTTIEKTMATEGFNFDFPTGLDAYRYIRLKWLTTYGSIDYVVVQEMTLYGQTPE